MATRLPRCFAAAAATAAAASSAAATTSGRPVGNSTNTSQASRRCRSGEEGEETDTRRGGAQSGLPATEKVGYASSTSSAAKRCGANNVRPSIDAAYRPSSTWKDAIASVRLGRVAYADADAAGFPVVVGEA
ncbi:unnamed protein product, partial [Laminaria digitata]